jgi:CBS domain-containing protein
MATGNFRHLIIADERRNVLGVVADRDIFRCQGRILEWQAKHAGEIMTLSPVTITPETLLSTAVSTMIAKKINCLPVVGDAGKVCGIVTSTDVMKSYHNMLESIKT